jgi:RNA polymerase sigma-70 factor (family 1)
LLHYIEFSDQALLRCINQDDRAAFTVIYRRHWQSLYNSAYKRTRNKEQCQDIVQNVFTDLWTRRTSIEIENLSAYLHTAVRFQVLKQASRQPLNSVFLDEFELIITSTVNADDPLLEKEILNLISLWIAALPEKRRKIFLMHYNDGLSTRQIAEALGISQKTVQNQLLTANQNLRLRLAHFLSVSVLLAFIAK